jgi:hypothetical protein
MAKAKREISNEQIKKIWACAKDAGLDEPNLRLLIKNLIGSDRISTLTCAQAIKVIDALLGNSRTYYASKEQIWKIEQLAQELGWSDDPKRLQGFIKKFAHVDNMRWLRAHQASDLIEGLKKMLQRQDDHATGSETPALTSMVK